MNRLAGFVLIGGFLSSAAAASGASRNHVPSEQSAYLAGPAVQQPVASVAQPLPVPAATPAPAAVTQRIIQASQAPTRAALPPAAAEPLAASQASSSPCPPAQTDLPCRKP
jgi:hypothetical protein